MDITVPMFVAENLFGDPSETEGPVYCADPKAPVYAKQHLQQVKVPISGALGVLRVHEKDIGAEASSLKRWIDAEVRRLEDSAVHA